MTDTFHMLVGDTLTMIHNGKSYAATSSHPKWKKLLKALAAKKFDKVATLCDTIAAVKEQIASEKLDSLLKVHSDGSVEYNGMPQGGRAAEYITRMIEADMNLTPVTKFLERLALNPSYHSREEALEFAVANELPITEDGRFMAYKRINGNWTDVYSGKIDNSVGAKVSMHRNDVDDNSSRTCSKGLHVCSKEYLRSYWGDRLIAVIIDPADVVSVPHDYNGSKMRVCHYEVAVELPISLIAADKPAWSAPVVDEEFEDMEVADEEVYDDKNTATGFVVLMADWKPYDVQNAAMFMTQKEAEDHTFNERELWLANESNGEIELLYQVK